MYGLECESRLAPKEVIMRHRVEHANVLCVCGYGDYGMDPGDL